MDLNNKQRKYILLGGLFLMVGLSVYVFSGQNELEPVLFNEKTAVVVANRNGVQQNEQPSS